VWRATLRIPKRSKNIALKEQKPCRSDKPYKPFTSIQRNLAPNQNHLSIIGGMKPHIPHADLGPGGETARTAARGELLAD